MPPPSPVWADGGHFQNAHFWFRVKIGDTWHSSPRVLLRVKGVKE
jgi:hypothetical protein